MNGKRMIDCGGEALPFLVYGIQPEAVGALFIFPFDERAFRHKTHKLNGPFLTTVISFVIVNKVKRGVLL